ncbi:hypothetical protein BVC80_9089g103 [Macleaya cordata]|uniref:Uncharacterized protein n=1 Tax=Macleaya cordata TaxID=56857 RepID=A0A200PQL4_MACCD|nr:hypothetical protein BVC80_9089g103 [Macleaya cordata]
MASTLISFRPTGIQACASSGSRKPDTNRRKTQSSNWWTPLFGWTSDPDYIERNDVSEKPKARSNVDSESRSRFMPGCFTEEKAKQLRMKTMESATFHDIMYHSAIASRLASDLPIRSDA